MQAGAKGVREREPVDPRTGLCHVVVRPDALIYLKVCFNYKCSCTLQGIGMFLVKCLLRKAEVEITSFQRNDGESSRGQWPFQVSKSSVARCR